MDAFYASVEQRDFPELRGKPIAVGGRGERGVVMTASYEARKFGVRSAMPGGEAERKCPELIFVPARFEAYREASKIIRTIFRDYTDLVEPLSLDEAYLDVTVNKYQIPYASAVANEIRQRIFEEIKLTASAGISFNKFLAKTASDMKKPNGQTVILPEDAEAVIATMAIEKFHGIGKATAAKMHEINIYTGADLKKHSEHELNQRFGKAGIHFYHIVRGNDQRSVNPNSVRKSISVEDTFRKNLSEKEAIAGEITKLSNVLERRAKKAEMGGRTLTLKLRYADFHTISRSITVDQLIIAMDDIEQLALHLLDKVEFSKPIRLIGLGLSNLGEEIKNTTPQLNFAWDNE